MDTPNGGGGKQECSVREGNRGSPFYRSEPESEPAEAGESKEEFGGGTFRFAFNGGSLANRSIRSLFMAAALISANPGL